MLKNRPMCILALAVVVILFLIKIGAETFRPNMYLNREQSQDGREKTESVYVLSKLLAQETKDETFIYYLSDTQVFADNPINSDNLNSQNNQIYSFNQINSNNQNNTNTSIKSRDLIKSNDPINPTIQNIICYSKEDLNLKIGSTVLFKGRLSFFESATNPGQFDAKSYYEILGYQARLYQPEIVAKGSEYDKLAQKLFEYRKQSEDFLYHNMKKENASVLAAMLLGNKSNMNPEVKSLYQRNGISHLLAISGLHIALIGMGLYRLLRRLGIDPKVCAVFSLLVLFLYVRMLPKSGSVFRAFVMFVLFLLAEQLERTYDMLTAMAFSALCLLLSQPLYLGYAGFLLSFLAVSSLAILSPVFNRLFERWEDSLFIKRYAKFYQVYVKIRSVLVANLSIQLLTVPCLLWFYYTYSPYSFFLNLLLVPLMTPILIFGCLGLIFRIPFLLIIPDFLLDFYEYVCLYTQSLPGSVLVTGRPPAYRMVIYYLGVFVLVSICYLWGNGQSLHNILNRENADGKPNTDRERIRKTKRINRAGVCMILAASVSLLFFIVQKPPARNAMYMLDVGQGDCIVLTTGQRNAVIVDCGSSSESQVGQYRLIPFLLYQGISRVDAVVVSHGHTDHVNGIYELLKEGPAKGIEVDKVWVSPLMQKSLTASDEENRKLSDLADTMNAMDSLSFGDLTLINLLDISQKSPNATVIAQDENNESLVLLARMQDYSILLTGDSSSQMDGAVCDALEKLAYVNILKVAHHGSSTSTSRELLETVQPKAALISCGEQNRYGHPHEETLDRLRDVKSQVFRTDQCGAISVRFEKLGIEIEAFCDKIVQK